MTDTLYEPRAFWQVSRTSKTYDADDTQPTQLELDRNNFYNGTDHPITITKIGLAPIKYSAVSGIGFGDRVAEAITSRVGVLISRRGVAEYAKMPIGVSNYVNLRTLATQALYNANARFSSMHGNVYGRFDKPLILPWKGALDFQISSWRPYGGLPGSDFTYPTFGVAFHEEGGQLNGNLRVKQQEQLLDWVPAGNVRYAGWIGDAGIGSIGAVQTGPDAVDQAMPPSHSFNARDWKGQDPSRQQGTPAVFSGVSAMIDQISIDDYARARIVTLTTEDPNNTLASFANMVGVRARTTNGGSHQEWWRPGMPLSLACNTITPATIHRLPQPFVMDPGDQMEVVLELPIITGGEVTLVFSVAVALLGYATLEGMKV